MITECFVVYLPAGRGLSGVDSSNGGRSTRGGGGGGGGGNARSNQRGGRGQKSVVQPNGLVSRRFGFVGFSTAEECARAHAYFDGAFMDTYRLKLEPARAKDEHAAAYDANSAERPWSKYSEGSSANREMKRKQTKEGSEYNDAAAAAAADDDDGKTNKKKAKTAQHVFTDEELAKDPKLREFLALASNKGSARGHIWANDDAAFEGAAAAAAAEAEATKAERRAAKLAKKEAAKLAAQQQQAEDNDGDDPMDDDDDDDDDAGGEDGADAGLSDLEYMRRRQVAGTFNEMPEQEEGRGKDDDDDDDESNDDDDDDDSEPAKSNRDAANGDGEHEDDVLAESNRLLLQNLPYIASEEELHDFLTEMTDPPPTQVHMVIDTSTGASRGFAYAHYADPETAHGALEQLGGGTFQGRVLRIRIAKPQVVMKEIPVEGDADEDGKGRGGRYQDIQERERRAAAVAGTDKASWNSLFVNSDTAASLAASRLGTSKAQLLGGDDSTPGGASAAVHVALAEAQVLQETIAYFESQGVNVASLQAARSEAKQNGSSAPPRSRTALLLKNLAAGVREEELRSLLEAHGPLVRLVYPPNGAPLALAEFSEASDARRALRALCFRKLRTSPLYLEWAPRDVLDGAAKPQQANSTPASEDAGGKSAPDAATDADADAPRSRSIYVRNLAFATDDAGLRAHAASIGSRRSKRGGTPWAGSLRAATVVKRPKPGSDGTKMLSAGFGFVELATPEEAARAARDLDGTVLDGHTLTAQVATGALRGNGSASAAAAPSAIAPKLVVRNVAFEATKKDLQQLFAAFGGHSVRLPKRGDGRHKGYAFVEFATRSEAATAHSGAQSLHLYGRPLSVEYATAEEAEDANLWRDASKEGENNKERARVRDALEKRAKKQSSKTREVEKARERAHL
ncbi:multiple RNA-binding domain-containing protein 1 [Pseudoscourfieldia marina]